MVRGESVTAIKHQAFGFNVVFFLRFGRRKYTRYISAIFANSNTVFPVS